MKAIKILLFIPATVYPYFVLSLFHFNNLSYGRLLSLIFGGGAIALILTAVLFEIIIHTCDESKPTAVAVMIIKLIQIPAYVFNFFAAALLAFSIIAIPFFFIIDCITILFTGLLGTSAVILARRENKLTGTAALLFGIAQFIFCIDVIAAIVLFVKIKASDKKSPVQN